MTTARRLLGAGAGDGTGGRRLAEVTRDLRRRTGSSPPGIRCSASHTRTGTPCPARRAADPRRPVAFEPLHHRAGPAAELLVGPLRSAPRGTPAEPCLERLGRVAEGDGAEAAVGGGHEEDTGRAPGSGGEADSDSGPATPIGSRASCRSGRGRGRRPGWWRCSRHRRWPAHGVALPEPRLHPFHPPRARRRPGATCRSVAESCAGGDTGSGPRRRRAARESRFRPGGGRGIARLADPADRRRSRSSAGSAPAAGPETLRLRGVRGGEEADLIAPGADARGRRAGSRSRSRPPRTRTARRALVAVEHRGPAAIRRPGRRPRIMRGW